MFDKLKLRKAPLSLSSVSNAIRNSGSTSLTPDLPSKHLKIVAGDQIGLPLNSVVAAAFDPVQSLIALATKQDSIHIYGQNCVEVVFELRTSGVISYLKFVKGIYLACIESSGNITILSLHTKQILATYSAPGAITAVECDPSMDWLILGMTNGSLLFYDVDRFHLTPLRIDNLQKLVLPKQKLSPVHFIQWHPRDIGTVLVTYSHCAVQYSLTSGAIKNAFIYRLTPECRGFEFSNQFETGGKKKLFGSVKEVIPRMKEAHFHPNGLHIVTVHNDGTLVFFDGNDGTLLHARTVDETFLHQPGPSVRPENSREVKLTWLTGQDPEETSILVTGTSDSNPDVIRILDFGITLKYSLTSNEKQGDFYANPVEGQRKLLVKFYRRLQEEGAAEHIISIIPIAPEGQPYFNGGHNPSHILALTSFGGVHLTELQPSTCAIQLPPSLHSICPPTTFSMVQSVRRIDWFGVISTKKATSFSDISLVSGGAPVDRHFPRTLGTEEGVNDILISGHEDGTVRCLDVTVGERQRGEHTIEFNLKDTLNNGASSASYRVLQVSFSFECKHAIVGLANGNVAICKFGKTSASSTTVVPFLEDYSKCAVLHSIGDTSIVDLTQRIAGKFTLPAFIPFSLLNLTTEDKITCLKMSNAGFSAVAYKSGRLIVCDIARGPAIILNLDSIKKHIPSVTEECFVTAIEFAIMEYGQDGFSSLLMFLGTNAGGNFLTFKIVPQRNGAFEVVFTDKSLGLNYRSSDTSAAALEKIMPVNATTGESAVATLDNFQRLGQNILIQGLVVVSSPRDLRVLKTPKQKLAHKVVDEACVSSGIIFLRDKGAVLAALTKSGFVKLFSLPALSDVADIKIPSNVYSKLKISLDGMAAPTSNILYSGEMFVKLSSSEILNLFLYDETKNKVFKVKPTDMLFNDTAIIPPRPSPGAMLWAKGQTTYISNKDLTSLIAGPNRKPAKHLESDLAYNISPDANPNQYYGMNGGPTTRRGNEENNYLEPVRKTTAGNPYAIGTQRFARGLRDGLDSVEEQINNYASGFSEAMNDTVDSLKKSMYSLAFKSKFGF